MRSIPLCVLFVAALIPGACLAQEQEWEVGAFGGYGWYNDATITNFLGSAQAGYKPGFTIGAVFAQNLYKYVGGEIRYAFRFGRPQLRFQDDILGGSGHTNLITYDFVVYTRSKESRVRPYLAAGAGIKIYSASDGPSFGHPFLFNRDINQVEAAISLGGGLKCMISRAVQFRADFRTYMTPLPERVFRSPTSIIHGWLYDFVPMVGFSYVF